jgi:alkanesulfonate monooxygenase SsuD/methylene tetrahydromethanopterin reductase-like flavin-dependent oxidoreductase (luciferase family)
VASNRSSSPEHTHIPTSRQTPYPLGGELPKEYSHTLDPFVAMTMAAAATTRLKVATGICLVIERDPLVLAKEVASVDWASNGRVIFGIGGGWNAEEMEDHGATFKSRWKLLRERIEAMKALWTADEASYHGEFVNFDSGLVLAQTHAEAASTDFAGQPWSAGDAAGDPVLRRLVTECRTRS